MKSQQCFYCHLNLIIKFNGGSDDRKLNLVFNCFISNINDYNRHANMERLLINVNWDTETEKQFKFEKRNEKQKQKQNGFELN